MFYWCGVLGEGVGGLEKANDTLLVLRQMNMAAWQVQSVERAYSGKDTLSEEISLDCTR